MRLQCLSAGSPGHPQKRQEGLCHTHVDWKRLCGICLGRCSSSTEAVHALCSALAKLVGVKAAPQLTTLLFVVMWYGLNVAFNLLNKSIFNYFPFPYTVSAVHVVVGLLYCSVAYLVGAKKASFGRVSMPVQGQP